MDDLLKEKILNNENDKAKLSEEINAVAKEHGIHEITALHGQDQFQVLNDLKNYGNKFSEELHRKEEIDQQKRAIKKKREEEQRSPRMSEEAYHRAREARERAAYEARRIVL